MNIKKLIKNNTKFIILMIFVITLGIIGMAYAITIGDFNPIGINTTVAEINAVIGYEDGSDGNITSTGTLLPISDTLVTLNTTDTRVLKVTFNVTGASSNPENTIYDISLRNINMDCELKSSDVKWRLYKESTKLTEGSFSPTFDTMTDNRMVLTEIQEDLTTNTSTYTLLIWISESCTGNITTCNATPSQNKYLNKTLTASIKVELSTKSKKTLVRSTGIANACSSTAIPVCNSNLVYNGTSQTLIEDGTNYTLVNQTGTNPGYYTVTAKLKEGYKWSDETSESKAITCEIGKKNVTITTLDQEITYGGQISSTTNDISSSGLISGHTLNSITLYSSIINVGTGVISASNAKITDTEGNDVTSNYNFIYNNIGIITINNAS